MLYRFGIFDQRTLLVGLALLVVRLPIAGALYYFAMPDPVSPAVQPVFIGVSIFDNETASR